MSAVQTSADPAGPEPVAVAAPGRLAVAMVAAAVLPHVAGSLLPPAWALVGTLALQGVLLAAVAWLLARR